VRLVRLNPDTVGPRIAASIAVQVAALVVHEDLIEVDLVTMVPA